MCYSYDLFIEYLIQIGFVYTFFKDNSAYSKVSMVLTLYSRGCLTKGYLPRGRRFLELQSMVFPERTLAVGPGFLNFLLLFYYHTVNESSVMKYTYISILNKHSGVLLYMVGWSARLILFYFIY